MGEKIFADILKFSFEGLASSPDSATVGNPEKRLM